METTKVDGGNMSDILEYVKLARETGGFRDMELDILKETLIVWQERPGDPYTLLELRDGKVLAGFALLCRASGTDFTWDIRCFCVERSFRNTGVGSSLLDMVEDEVLRRGDSAIIRSETSKRKLDTAGSSVYESSGYSLIGHIVDFYEQGDDYFIWARHAFKAVAKEQSASAPAAPPSPDNT